MAWQYNPFVLPLLGAALLCMMIALFVWNRRPAPGAAALVVLMVATATYSLTVTLGMSSTNLVVVTFCWLAMFVAVVAIWPAWLVFAIEYTGRHRWLTRRNLALLALPPLAVLALVFTNDYHYLVSTGFTLSETGNFVGYTRAPGPVFFLHLIFADLCALAGTVLLAQWAVQLPRAHRWHVFWLLSGATAPLVGRLATTIGGLPVNLPDLSPFVLPLTGLAWAYGLLRFGLYGVVPVARESIFRNATDGVLALDILGRVADANPAAERLLGIAVPEVNGRSLREILPQLPVHTDLSQPVETELPLKLVVAEGKRTLEVRFAPVFTRNRRFSGHVVNLRDITEMQQALVALDRANRQSSDILASISDGFFALDGNYAITYFNRAAETLLGCHGGDVLGRPVFDAFPELRDYALIERYADAVRSEQAFSFELFLDVAPYRNWYEIRVYPSDPGLAVYFRVTTEQKRASEALRASEEKFRGVVEQSQDGIALVDESGSIVEWNAGQEAITGIGREQAVGRPLLEVQEQLSGLPDDDGGTAAAIRRAGGILGAVLAGQSPTASHEATIRRPDGKVRLVQSLIFPIRTSSGVLVGSVNRDVTERHEAENHRAALYRIARAATESSDLPQLFGVIHEAVSGLIPAQNFHIALYDQDTGLVSFPYLVDVACPVSRSRRDGRGRAEYVMRTGMPLLADEVALRALVATGEIDAEGTIAWSYLGVPLRGRSGVIGVMAAQCYHGEQPFTEAHRDLLMLVSGQVAMAIERKRAEEALRRNEAQLSALMNGMAAGVAIVQNGECRFANPAMEAITGFPAQQLRGLGFWETIDPGDRSMLEERGRARRDGRPVASQYGMRVRRPGGEVRWLAMVSNPIEFEGAPARLLSALDVTEQRRLQEQVVASQKLSGLGTVAAGVAHELNSPLQVITGMAHTLAERQTDGSLDQALLARGLDQIERNGWRCADIVRSLLTYARPSSPQVASVDLNAVVRDGLLLIEYQLHRSSDITVETRLEEGLPPLVCDHNQIVQVLINLLTNARDAMPNGGHIVVTTAHLQPEGKIVLQVEDDGVGMPESVRTRIFDPFFTTKEPGEGTGLGLSIVSGIVRSCGGEVAVESTPGRGSRFTLTFPQSPAPESEASLAEDGGRYDIGAAT
ncbi:MAG: PAS domain S-box protein [Anaerolineae bacterium]